MKKLLFCFVVSVCTLTGCGKQVIDYASLIDYIYVNECSSEITIRAFSFDGYEISDYKGYPYTIPVKGMCKISLIGEGFMSPFDCSGGPQYYVVVSNKEKTVTQKGGIYDDLYSMESYITLSKEKHNATLLYVFTDDFFEDGEPVE